MISKLRVFLTVVLIASATQVSSTSTAAAWTGSLPSCSGYPIAWQSELEADSRYTSNTSWVAFRRDWWGSPFNGGNALLVVWDQPNTGSQSLSNQLFFVGNGIDDTENALSSPVWSTSFFTVDGNGITEISSPYNHGTSVEMGDLNCVEDTHNVQYYGWTGSAYPDAVDDYTSAVLEIGSVDCGGVDPVGVNIYQNGNNGSAVLSSISGGRANWSYYLTGAPYGFQVLCGSDVAISYGTVSPATASGDWVCNLIDDPHYCVLS